MRTRAGLLAVAVLGWGAALMGPGLSPARAVLTACNDGVGGAIEVPIIVSPITVAVEVTDTMGPGHVGVCYDSGPALPGSASETIFADAQPSSPGTTLVRCFPGGVSVGCWVSTGLTPTVALGSPPPGYPAGETLVVNIPVVVCVGGPSACPVNTAVAPGTTGVGTGSLSALIVCGPSSAPDSGQQCSLTGLALVANGTSVQLGGSGFGAGYHPGNVVYQDLHSDPNNGPCVETVCPPIYGVVASTGHTFFTFFVATPDAWVGGQRLLGPIGVSPGAALPYNCAYHFGEGCPPPTP